VVAIWSGPLGAHSSAVEHLTFNQRADGSTPSGLTIFQLIKLRANLQILYGFQDFGIPKLLTVRIVPASARLASVTSVEIALRLERPSPTSALRLLLLIQSRMRQHDDGHVFSPAVKGSMASSDGKAFLMHVEREDGGDLMLGFPHAEIPTIVEDAATQAIRGKDDAWEQGSNWRKAS
jgi:hypothetical protein